MTHLYEIFIILTVALFTFMTRLLPFVLFGRHKEPPKLVQYLGKILPSSIIAILIVYCIKGMSFDQSIHYLPYCIAIPIVALLHIWKRNILISISVGTASYMIMMQFIFV